MQRVQRVAEGTPNPNRFAAVLIGRSPGTEDQHHIGIAHTTTDGRMTCLHLAWHHDLRSDLQIPNCFTLWVDPAAPSARLRQVAARCRHIWKVNGTGNIPYAFSSPDGAFDQSTHKFLLGPTRHGLTCASFVLAVFQVSGLSLINYDTWPRSREGDTEWQEKIIKALGADADEGHLTHLQEDLGAARYRPEEVAAATALAPPPVAFQPAEELSMEIVRKLRDSNP